LIFSTANSKHLNRSYNNLTLASSEKKPNEDLFRRKGPLVEKNSLIQDFFGTFIQTRVQKYSIN